MLVNQKTDEFREPGMINIWQQMMDYHLKLDPVYFRMVKNADKLMKKFITKNINSKNSNVLVAVKNDSIIGYTMGYLENWPPVYKVRAHGYISDLAVDKKYSNFSVCLISKVFSQAYYIIEEMF